LPDECGLATMAELASRLQSTMTEVGQQVQQGARRLSFSRAAPAASQASSGESVSSRPSSHGERVASEMKAKLQVSSTRVATPATVEHIISMAASAAWHAANKRSLLESHAKRDLLEFDARKESLARLLSEVSVEEIAGLLMSAAWYAANTRRFLHRDASRAYHLLGRHVAMVSTRFSASFASLLRSLALAASWHAANQRSFKWQHAERDHRDFASHAAQLVRFAPLLDSESNEAAAKGLAARAIATALAVCEVDTPDAAVPPIDASADESFEEPRPRLVDERERTISFDGVRGLTLDLT
jgi:hypothetical protein